MYADDVVLQSESKEGIECRLNEWRLALESREMKVSLTNTEYKMCTELEQDRRERIRLAGEGLTRVDAFEYPGSTKSADGSEDREISGRIQAGWRSCGDVFRVLCDRKMPVKLKGKAYKEVVRPAITYGAKQ